jgi:hypothetical protein
MELIKYVILTKLYIKVESVSLSTLAYKFFESKLDPSKFWTYKLVCLLKTTAGMEIYF